MPLLFAVVHLFFERSCPFITVPYVTQNLPHRAMIGVVVGGFQNQVVGIAGEAGMQHFAGEDKQIVGLFFLEIPQFQPPVTFGCWYTQRQLRADFARQRMGLRIKFLHFFYYLGDRLHAGLLLIPLTALCQLNQLVPKVGMQGLVLFLIRIQGARVLCLHAIRLR